MIAPTASAAEDEFYRAFAAGDLAAMVALWDRGDDTVCIHPGREAIRGHARIAESWREILGDGTQFDIHHQRITRHHQEGLAVHTGVERIMAGDRAALLTVTNAFRLTGDGWKLILHHAAPIHAVSAPEGQVH